MNLLAHFEAVHHDNAAAYSKARGIIESLVFIARNRASPEIVEYWQKQAEEFYRDFPPVLANPFVMKMEGERS